MSERVNGNVLQNTLESILEIYANATPGEGFGKEHVLWSRFEQLRNELASSQTVKNYPTVKVTWSAGKGRLAKVPWVAFLDTRETDTTQRRVYCVFLFRQDMSGVYLTYNQGVTELNRQYGRTEAHEKLRSRADELREQCTELRQHGFSLDNRIDLRADRGLGADYEYSTIAYKLYHAGAVPSDYDILQDIDAVLSVYEAYVTAKHDEPIAGHSTMVAEESMVSRDLVTAAEDVISFVAGSGFIFEPWQIAAYITALRTKPFIILAGVSGTGKSKLPKLVSEATGGKSQLIPVRPDWTDSSDVLGYEDLQGRFRPGPLLHHPPLPRPARYRSGLSR
ncbi:MAG: DUF3578 domain-containing protein [Chloroflexota bacterium]|nr:DUF3578 domain-containing protein [Chloroflexota bacterium]